MISIFIFSHLYPKIEFNTFWFSFHNPFDCRSRKLKFCVQFFIFLCKKRCKHFHVIMEIFKNSSSIHYIGPRTLTLTQTFDLDPIGKHLKLVVFCFKASLAPCRPPNLIIMLGLGPQLINPLGRILSCQNPCRPIVSNFKTQTQLKT